MRRNQPNVHEVKKLDNGGGWHGAQLTLLIAGHWQYYRAKILKYLRQIAVITPYLRFTFKYTSASGDDKAGIDLAFRRRADKMPAPPQVPHGPPVWRCCTTDFALQTPRHKQSTNSRAA